MSISVIIPTWNEKPWLEMLINSLKKCPTLHEIIVADNHSVDGTSEIAIEKNCILVTGGLPSEGRNAGARIATGDILLFIDADTIVTPSHLQHIKKVFENSPAIGILFPIIPMTNNSFVRICYRIMDIYLHFLWSVGINQGIGALIAVRSESFREVGGFRKNVAVAEDADFIRRLGELGIIAYDRRMTVMVSARRFCVEKPIVFSLKCVFWALLRLMRLKASVFQYSWQRYPEYIAEHDRNFIATFNRDHNEGY